MNNDVVISKVNHSQISINSYLFVKKLFDIIISLILVIFLLPISIFIKISYLLSGDTHSIFFSQKRIGKNGKEFNLYKYRTMIVNADEELEKLLKNNKELAKEYEKNKKLQNDPRITKIGKFLRKTSLDEFPQFINVLKGEMSVIGNRPYLPKEKKDMGSYYNDIVKTKPGITGYWQVSGRSDTSFKQRLKLEKEYSNIAGLRLDLKIFFRTFKVVLFHKGAK